ncbi:MAG: 23S rRNA (guanosine(2251)-2'-O)-methyltransferase RlmB [Treponema lecithinolyticum]|jgi:RNA methyltransferase, trmH family, group 3|uniref:RNA methyltransferase, TrmH family, group 3 n=1 Tax=Treponema lecithinolyticum ATCC 700332 TaxID=1321815 RepID=A0ABN0NWF0_TRELE|nr:23S rRNA (guanosine(2251)-2'-O)-methyltransferase RlmB [Treponema lecithinolyticum]ERJ91661.1 RNA methyltransferase, TrmH family, group 3 [Treponema lecithinolyticum ATCC 700332]
MKVITGFHAIEERLRSIQSLKKGLANAEKDNLQNIELHYAKTGPRVKKISALAGSLHIPCIHCTEKDLDALVKDLSVPAQDHRGAVLLVKQDTKSAAHIVDFDIFIAQLHERWVKEKKSALVVVLDSLTDPHNVGAVLRSCDQLGADLVVLPENRAVSESEIIERSSAGASAWVATSLVTNLVRAVEKLQKCGFWVYAADAHGTSVHKTDLTGCTAFVLGSEGSGVSRLLAKTCDGVLSVPCCGKLDSLNVSVAAGILLYERRRQCLEKARSGSADT